jgi:excisionase family DNA binding protein
MSTTLEPSRLSPSDQGALRSLLDALHGPAARSAATLTVGSSKKPLSLPHAALGLVTELVEHLAAGRSVTVLSGEEEISPREAAELLAVSRPFAARLFDEGQIPSRRVGTHRRAFVKDVLAYRDRQQAARLAALDELAAEGQRLKLGY